MGAVTIDSLEIKLTTTGSKGKSALNGLSSSMSKMGKASGAATLSFANLVAKVGVATMAVKKIGRAIGSSITEVNNYIENMNLFNVSMGQYAEQAGAYAEKVQSVLGVDVSEFIRNQGVFMTLSTGFGVAGDRAETMSKNLTQLGYDISSFFNISTSDAMQKLQSGLSGELEPLRRLGYDLSQAKLEATALELGITKNISAMTQAEKAQLRYYAIMNQVTTAQGDMARTIDQPANQLRVLKSQFDITSRAIGSMFIPALTTILPIANALLRIVEKIASALAGLLGYEAPKFENTGIDGLASGAEDTAEGLDDASKAAKKLKNYTMGFDELNVIDPSSGSSGSGADDSSAGWKDFELPEYDFLGDATGGKVNEIVDNITRKLKEVIVITDELQESLDSLGTENEIPISVGMVTESVVLTAQNIVLTLFEDINNLLYNTDWKSIGSTVGTLLSTALTSIDISALFVAEEEMMMGIGIALLDIISGAIDGVAWGEVLSPLATELEESIRGVGDLDWGRLGSSISGVFDSIFEAIKEVDWYELGIALGDLPRVLWETLVEIVGKVDWAEIASSLFTALGGAIAGATSFIVGLAESIWGILKDAWAELKAYFEQYLDTAEGDMGKAIIYGVFDGIINALVGIYDWLKENVFTPFIEGFKEVFDINSPSRVMEEQGGFLVDGLLGGITSAWVNITGFFSEKWETLKTDTTNAWASIKETALEKWTDIKHKLVEKVVDIKDSLHEKFTDVKDSISKIWTDLKDSIYSTINLLLSGIEGMANGVVKGINKVLKALNKLQIDVPDWVTDLTGVSSFGFNFKMIDEVQIPRLMADGGFLETGELFIAREAGAEMVGSIGRRTAVANNDQIVSGIASGVAEANSEQNSLLREQNNLLRALLEKDTSTNIDGRRLSKELDRVQRERGATIIMGGAY